MRKYDGPQLTHGKVHYPGKAGHLNRATSPSPPVIKRGAVSDPKGNFAELIKPGAKLPPKASTPTANMLPQNVGKGAVAGSLGLDFRGGSPRGKAVAYPPTKKVGIDKKTMMPKPDPRSPVSRKTAQMAREQAQEAKSNSRKDHQQGRRGQCWAGPRQYAPGLRRGRARQPSPDEPQRRASGAAMSKASPARLARRSATLASAPIRSPALALAVPTPRQSRPRRLRSRSLPLNAVCWCRGSQASGPVRPLRASASRLWRSHCFSLCCCSHIHFSAMSRRRIWRSATGSSLIVRCQEPRFFLGGLRASHFRPASGLLKSSWRLPSTLWDLMDLLFSGGALWHARC